MKTIFTIGHSTYPLDHLISRLRASNVDCLIDVRSIPFSKYAPQFNATELQYRLKKEGIVYLPMGKEFGARHEDPTLFAAEGYLDFDRLKSTPSFLHGLYRLDDGLNKGYVPALMCTEKDPVDCHRSILVARECFYRGNTISHILADGTIESHEHLEERLIDIYYPRRDQLTIWDMSTPEMSREQLLSKAYARRGKDIGYQLPLEGRMGG